MNLNKMRIEEFCKTGSGGTPSRKNESYYQGNIPWVKSGDLREKAIIETEEYISELALKESSAKLVEKGAILLAMYGATVGRMARLGVNAATNQAVCHIIPDENIVNAQYLYYALLNKVPEFLEKAVGGAQPNINQGVIKATEIYLPSLSTQTQIAQILDKSTALIAKRKAQIAELDDLISACYKNVLSKSEKRCVKISNVVRDISTGKSYASLEESPYKVLKTSAVSYGFFNENEVKNLPINYTPPPEHLLRKGDILVSRMNTEELVGASAFVWKDYSNIAIPDRLWKLHLVDSVNPIFIWKTLQQDFFRKSIRVNSSGTSGSMKNISQANFMNLEIYLPDLKTQIQFAQIAEKIHAQKSLLQKSLAELEVQHQALMQKAFNGQLVG